MDHAPTPEIPKPDPPDADVVGVIDRSMLIGGEPGSGKSRYLGVLLLDEVLSSAGDDATDPGSGAAGEA